MEMEQQLRKEEWKEKCPMLAICDMTAAENEDKFTNYNWELRWELGQLSLVTQQRRETGIGGEGHFEQSPFTTPLTYAYRIALLNSNMIP